MVNYETNFPEEGGQSFSQMWGRDHNAYSCLFLWEPIALVILKGGGGRQDHLSLPLDSLIILMRNTERKS